MKPFLIGLAGQPTMKINLFQPGGYTQNNPNHRAAARNWKKRNAYRNKKYQREYHLEWRKRNAEQIIRNRRPDWLPRAYGITEYEYHQLLTSQGGGCAICGKTKTAKNLPVDHCHTTGAVRGILCNACNVGLGRFNDDVDLLIKAVSYLQKWKGLQ